MTTDQVVYIVDFLYWTVKIVAAFIAAQIILAVILFIYGVTRD